MLTIFIYHIIVRFPQLQEFTQQHLKKSQSLIIKIYNFMKIKKAKNATINNSVAIEQVNQMPQTQQGIICVTVHILREPLLESGTTEFFHINPPSAPTWMQTTCSNC